MVAPVPPPAEAKMPVPVPLVAVVTIEPETVVTLTAPVEDVALMPKVEPDTLPELTVTLPVPLPVVEMTMPAPAVPVTLPLVVTVRAPVPLVLPLMPVVPDTGPRIGDPEEPTVTLPPVAVAEMAVPPLVTLPVPVIEMNRCLRT
jgi:hypothetical protein